MNCLNPVARVRDQIRDGLKITESICPPAPWMRIAELLTASDCGAKWRHVPARAQRRMKQRVCMAIAISLRPKLIIADEPTTALDVVVQRQVMDTLLKVQDDLGASIILIGHDMGLMAQAVDRVGIMYAGNFAEVSNVNDLFVGPLHPYINSDSTCLRWLRMARFQVFPSSTRRFCIAHPVLLPARSKGVRAVRVDSPRAYVELNARFVPLLLRITMTHFL